MNDFVKISKNLTSETPDFSCCMNDPAYFSKGENCSYQIHKINKQHTDLQVRLNESTGTMTVSGNLGMFWNGHNLKYGYDEMQNTVEYLSESLRVNLFPAEVKEFDHSAVISTDLNPDDVFHKHISIPGHEKIQYKHGIYFKKPGTQVVKFYDAGIRLKQLNSKAKRGEIYSSLGIHPLQRMIRFEKKILHPDRYFKSTVFLSDLIDHKFIDFCNLDLLETYASMKKLNTLNLPADKKHLSAATIPLILLKELEHQYGFNFEDRIKKTISAIPDIILSKDDKKARRRQIKANLSRISREMSRDYDLSESLLKSLKMPQLI